MCAFGGIVSFVRRGGSFPLNFITVKVAIGMSNHPMNTTECCVWKPGSILFTVRAKALHRRLYVCLYCSLRKEQTEEMRHRKKQAPPSIDSSRQDLYSRVFANESSHTSVHLIFVE
uniref:Uncharacterized protein n=1 Tax=Parascaris univalens TaxID=6257 RepID=A0A915C753_PARUN